MLALIVVASDPVARGRGVTVRRAGSLLVAAGCLFLPWGRDALASRAIVPDDHATIQAAIDSGADTVLVRSGRYDEHVRIERPLALADLPAPLSPYNPGYDSESFPVVAALTVGGTESSGYISVRGFHFTGPVRLPEVPEPSGYPRVAFEMCRMDSGLHQPGTGRHPPETAVFHLLVRGCTIIGDVRLTSRSLDFTLNSVIGGGLEVIAYAYHNIRGNVILGPAKFGIDAIGERGQEGIRYNLIRNVGDGIVNRTPSGDIRHNEISDCSGTGIRGTGGAFVLHNRIERCGGYGVEFTPSSGRVLVDSNRVDRVGLDGIKAHVMDGHATATGNVVSRAAGHGLNVGGVVLRNTAFQNGRSGFLASSVVEGNIGYENAEFGVEWTGGETPNLACNDWFGNLLGAVSGGPPGPTDLAVDPLFCGVKDGDVSLRSDSPLLDAPGCGQIGALGLGCMAPTAEANFRVSPEALGLQVLGNPSSATVDLELALPSAKQARLILLDVQGRQVEILADGPFPAGRHRLAWDARRVPAGIYFLQLEAEGARSIARVAVTH